MSEGDTPEGDPPPEELWGYAALEDVDVVVVRVFGVDPDARIWTNAQGPQRSRQASKRPERKLVVLGALSVFWAPHSS